MIEFLSLMQITETRIIKEFLSTDMISKSISVWWNHYIYFLWIVSSGKLIMISPPLWTRRSLSNIAEKNSRNLSWCIDRDRYGYQQQTAIFNMSCSLFRSIFFILVLESLKSQRYLTLAFKRNKQNLIYVYYSSFRDNHFRDMDDIKETLWLIHS